MNNQRLQEPLRGKKGISVVVVSVFLILLTVALITISWFWIVPWTQDIDSSNNLNANLRVVLEGYTAFDVEHNMAFVQIKRGADDVNLRGLEVIFNVDGNSFVFEVPNFPDNNQMETYRFNFSDAKIVGVPKFVKVAPVFLNKEIGVAMGEVAIPVTKIYSDDWEAEGVKAKQNTLKSDVIEEIIIEPVSICKDDFVIGELYPLDRNLQVTDGNDCFVIDVDNVVLDLNGYLIRGSYSGYGVHITGKNVTVKNGRIEKFEKGVFIDGVLGYNNNTIANNDFFDNNNSVYILSSMGNIISGNNMTNGNYSNIYLMNNADNNHIVNNWACYSPNDLRCEGDSTDNTGYKEGNVFNVVVGCQDDWSLSNGGYTQCL